MEKHKTLGALCSFSLNDRCVLSCGHDGPHKTHASEKDDEIGRLRAESAAHLRLADERHRQLLVLEKEPRALREKLAEALECAWERGCRDRVQRRGWGDPVVQEWHAKALRELDADEASDGVQCPTENASPDHWPESISDGLTLSCDMCGRMTVLDYRVTEDLWQAAAPRHSRLGVICLECFTALADRKGLDLASNLVEAQWVGDGYTIVLKPHRIIRWWHGEKGALRALDGDGEGEKG